MKSKSLTIIGGLLVGTGALWLDRLTKSLVMHGSVKQGPVLFAWIEITTHKNFGLLGDLSVNGWLIIVLTLLALGLLVYGLREAWVQGHARDFLALGLVLGGALGNLYDRLAYGYVFDWLMFFKTSIVNGADIMITLGLVAYAVLHLGKRPMQDVDCHDQSTKDQAKI